MARPCMAGAEQPGYPESLAPPSGPSSSLAVSSTVPLSSLRAAKALRRSPVPSPGQVSPGLLPEALELRQEAVSMIRLLRFPSLEHGDRQVSLLVPVHGGRASCETLRYGPVRSTGDQGLVDGLVLGVGADGAGSGHQGSRGSGYNSF